jgi:hypothetical protein
VCLGNIEALIPSLVEICPNKQLWLRTFLMILVRMGVCRIQNIAQENTLSPVLLGRLCLNNIFLKFTEHLSFIHIKKLKAQHQDPGFMADHPWDLVSMFIL